MNLKKILLISFLTTTIASPNCWAVPCEEKLNACIEVVRAGNALIGEQQQTIDKYAQVVEQQDTIIKLLEVRIEEVQPSWYERPAVVGPVAFVLGFIVMRAVSK